MPRILMTKCAISEHGDIDAADTDDERISLY